MNVPPVLQVARMISQPTAEEWWAKMARLLSEKMKQSGVSDFRITLTERGTYQFEVTPVGHNEPMAGPTAKGGSAKRVVENFEQQEPT